MKVLYIIFLICHIKRDRTISDIRLVISAVLCTSTPSRYFDRPNFTTRAASLGKWMIAGFFISLAYKEILLSTLVTTTYAKSINTINDMLNSKVCSLSYQQNSVVLKHIFLQFELVTPARTATEALMRTDPRESIQGLVPRMKPFPYRGNIPDKIHES